MALVLGAGKMGMAIAHDLMENGIDVRICDIKHVNFPNSFILDARDEKRLTEEMRKEDIVISALPYDFNYKIAKIALKTGANFIDLGGNSYIVKKEIELHEKARKSKITIIPDCGLAPGMTNVIAHEIWNNGAKEIHIRVGGLPQKPSTPLKYALFFSVHGLINEYIEDSIVVRNGKIMKKESLTGLEKIKFEGFPEMEAFYTHGGTSTLPQTLYGIKELDYKTIRYEGHCEKIMLLKKLGFFDEGVRNFTEKVLEKNLPKNEKDVVLARVYGNEEKMELIDYYDDKSGFSAVARTTGFSTAIIAKMVLDGEVKEGAFPPEIAVDFQKFIAELKRRKILWKSE